MANLPSVQILTAAQQGVQDSGYRPNPDAGLEGALKGIDAKNAIQQNDFNYGTDAQNIRANEAADQNVTRDLDNEGKRISNQNDEELLTVQQLTTQKAVIDEQVNGQIRQVIAARSLQKQAADLSYIEDPTVVDAIHNTKVATILADAKRSSTLVQTKDLQAKIALTTAEKDHADLLYTNTKLAADRAQEVKNNAARQAIADASLVGDPDSFLAYTETLDPATLAANASLIDNARQGMIDSGKIGVAHFKQSETLLKKVNIGKLQASQSSFIGSLYDTDHAAQLQEIEAGTAQSMLDPKIKEQKVQAYSEAANTKKLADAFKAVDITKQSQFSIDGNTLTNKDTGQSIEVPAEVLNTAAARQAVSVSTGLANTITNAGSANPKNMLGKDFSELPEIVRGFPTKILEEAGIDPATDGEIGFELASILKPFSKELDHSIKKAELQNVDDRNNNRPYIGQDTTFADTLLPGQLSDLRKSQFAAKGLENMNLELRTATANKVMDALMKREDYGDPKFARGPDAPYYRAALSRNAQIADKMFGTNVLAAGRTGKITSLTKYLEAAKNG